MTRNIITELEDWITDNYKLRKNTITRMIENDAVPMEADDVNSMYIAARKRFARARFEDIVRLINSNYVQRYNPIQDFFEQNKHKKPTGLINKLFSTIITEDNDYATYFGTKWLVSIIASTYGEHSPLMLVLSGPKTGTGKTQWFRRLPPDPLKRYFADISTGMKENDFHILMTQKLFLLDDEFDAKRKKEENAMKSLLSKQEFSIREPYGRSNVTLQRIAVLCGTTNDENILADTTTNRRFIPVNVERIDKDLYNSINKTDLFIEAYHLWKKGFEWDLTQDEIEVLSGYTSRFENFSIEYELVCKYFDQPTFDNASELTATEIKNRLETLSVQKLNLDQVGKALQQAGFKQCIKKVNGKTKRIYSVYEPMHINGTTQGAFVYKPARTLSTDDIF